MRLTPGSMAASVSAFPALLIWFCAVRLAAANGGDSPVAADGGFDEVAAMLTRMGGFVDPRVRVGILPYGVRGLLATADIPANTVVIHVPTSAVLAPVDREAKSVDSCALVDTILAELRKGEQSAWWPYLRFDDSLGSKVLDTWSREELNELQGLPPDDAGRDLEWYMKHCRPGVGSYAELSAHEQQAIWMQGTRGSDVGLMPIYDLMNHNNGELNTVMQHAETSGLNVVTRHDIENGSELFNSYAHHETSSLFRDYGFLEDYPHLWSFDDADGKRHRLVLLEPTGPVLLLHVHDDYDMTPGNSYLSNKVEDALQLLAATSGQELLSSLEAAEWLLDAQPTTAEEDELLAQGATGNVLRAIKYRIAVKHDLARIAGYLELRVREKSDYRWEHRHDDDGEPQGKGSEPESGQGEGSARDEL